MKQIIIVALAVIAIVGGAVVLSGDKESSLDEGTLSNNFYGQEDGIVTVTEYGDFQCPSCAQFYPIVSQIKEQFADQIRFEFRHFPLVQIHPNAQAAHRAAEAAGNQGKFWEMHDLLYERQQSWSSGTNPASVFESYAQEIALDMEQYRTEVSSSEILATINADVASGKDLDVTGTPTFFIDGQRIDDLNTVSSVEGFATEIQIAIEAKSEETTENDDQPAAPEEESTEPEDAQAE